MAGLGAQPLLIFFVMTYGHIGSFKKVAYFHQHALRRQVPEHKARWPDLRGYALLPPAPSLWLATAAWHLWLVDL